MCFFHLQKYSQKRGSIPNAADGKNFLARYERPFLSPLGYPIMAVVSNKLYISSRTESNSDDVELLF